MSETRALYTASVGPASETHTDFVNFGVHMRRDHYSSFKALSKTYNFPMGQLLTLAVGIGLQHLTPEQIIQARDARAKVLKETWKPRPKK